MANIKREKEKQALIDRRDRLLEISDPKKWKDKDELEFIADFLENGKQRLASISEEIGPDFKNRSLLPHIHRSHILSEMDYLKRMKRVDLRIPDIDSFIERLTSDIDKLLKDIEKTKQAEIEVSGLKNRHQWLSRQRQILLSYKKAVLDESDIVNSLNNLDHELERTESHIGRWTNGFVLVVIGAFVFAMYYAGWSYPFGYRRGLETLKEIEGDFNKLLDFVQKQ